MERHETVEQYLKSVDQWRSELVQLRKILKSTDLKEEVKWGGPCYTYDGKNVVGLGAFKSYFGLWFFQGALLKDTKKLLVNAQQGKTRALRQWRMTSKKEIDSSLIRAYVKEAIDLCAKGKELKPQRDKPLAVPAQLKQALTKNKKAAACFQALTRGKQREYAEYISDAKRDETKQLRLQKIIPLILSKKGLNDKYRSC